MSYNIHVIGGGINGLLSALYFKHLNEDCKVFIHEFQPKIGGKLRGFEYEHSNLYFDQGTHIFQESGHQFLDQTLRNSVNKEKLIIFPRGKGDIVGSIQKDYLKLNSHFIDLREDKKTLMSIRKHLFSKVKPLKNINIHNSVLEELNTRFGEEFAIKYGDLFSDIFKNPVKELSAISLLFTGFTRVILEDLPKWKNESVNETYRSIVGVPNQLELPDEYVHDLKSFYAKPKGTLEFINGLEELILSKGIQIITNSRIKQINKSKKYIEYHQNQIYNKLDYDKILISSGVISAVKLLKPTLRIDTIPPMKSAFLNVELKTITKNDLFYFYNFSSTINFYRVTNYRAFSKDENDKRITIECFLPNDNPEDYCKKILLYLNKIDFIENINYKHFYYEEKPFGFPVLTNENINKINFLNRHLNSVIDDNIQVSGIGTDNFNFFTNEIIINSFKKIDQLMFS